MRAPAFVLGAALILFTTASAHAQETQETEDAPQAPARERSTHLGPIVGLSLGSWMGVPITRVPVGLDIVHKPQHWDAALAFHATVAPGRTENGLGAHRAEIGFGLSTPPSWLRFAGGAHLAYAMLERTTLDDSFVRSLFGNIGGFGVGAHAALEGAFHIAGSAHGTFGLRASADAYDGGFGYEGGPFAGVRF